MLKGARHRAIRERLKVICQKKDNRKDIAALVMNEKITHDERSGRTPQESQEKMHTS